MLILTRRIGESLMIGDNITVTVMAIKGGQVRMAIDAPRSTPIYREELLKQKEAERLERHMGVGKCKK